MIADQDARRRIAEDHASTLFVEAGAGSGKTSSLVSRVVSLVLAGADVTSIAAITFTEAAAAELRARVRRTLEDVEAGREISWVDDTPEARAAAARALDQLDRATICTLHAFAQRLLLAAPIEARLPPAVEVHDDISSSLRADDRWHRFEHQLLDDDALAETVRMAWTLGIGPRDLRAVAETLGQNWDLVEEARDAGLVDHDRRRSVDLSVLHVDHWIAQLTEIEALLARCTEPDDDLLARWVTGTAVPLRAALAALADDPYDLVLLATSGLKPPGRNTGRKGCWPDGTKADVIEAGGAVIAQIEREVAALTDQVLTRLGAEIALATLADADARRREGRLEFHDLLVLARQVLRTERGVRARFHDRFRHLLIDEFQDTDPIQIELAVRIAADPDHDPATPWHEVEVEEGRLFFVGDPKQSIYRFRRADIGLFSQTADRYTAGTATLRVNFRTTAPVLAFCNAVFGGEDDRGLIRHTVEPETGATAQPRYVPLEAHRSAIPDDPGPPVVVLGPDEPHASAEAARTAEAADVAAVLARAHAEGWQVHPGGEPRPCRWSDMAVLLPSRTTLAHLRSSLDDAGIPYRLESGTLVYGTTEVGDLLAVLRAIDDPGDAIAAVGALRSPAYGCGDDDLLRWTRAHGRITYLGGAVRPDDELAQLDPAEVDPVERALADLRARHRRAPFQAVPEIVSSVVRDRRLLELCLAGGRHRDGWRLHRIVVEHARQFADTEAGGLRAFLRWAELQRDDKLRATTPVIPEADVDAVRILTIHGAKGLEFGITAVSGLSAQDPNQARGATVRFAAGGGFEMRMRKGMETTRFESVRTVDETMDEHERIRLLYVALTRARDHLVVSAHHTRSAVGRSHGGRLASRLAALGSALDGIAVRWTSSPDDPPAAAVADLAPSPGLPSAEEWEATVARLRARRSGAVQRAGADVRSATAIARRAVDADADEDDERSVPQREPWRRGRAGTAVGSAVHAVLQHADLAAPDGGAVASLARWQASVEGLAPDVVPVVEAKVRAALRSPLVRRAVGSGRLHRELLVAAPLASVLGVEPGSDGGELVEGFVDLCFEEGDGLVVVDYKTDDVPSEAAVGAALERYAPQGAAYALLLEAATGRRVDEVHFLFLRGTEAVDAPVPDLAGAKARVLEQLRGAPFPTVVA
ncbi:MAG: UvrD-helicase domain-containing protein [Acidimicrobiia bacterium]